MSLWVVATSPAVFNFSFVGLSAVIVVHWAFGTVVLVVAVTLSFAVAWLVAKRKIRKCQGNLPESFE